MKKKTVKIRGPEQPGGVPWVEVRQGRYEDHEISVCRNGLQITTIVIDDDQVKDLYQALSDYFGKRPKD